MVSPSKVQHQEERHSTRENISDRHSHVRIKRGPKPLEKKSFYLDIKNHALSTKLEGKIKELGGTIELFLVRSVNIVVSDRVKKVSQINSEKHNKWGCTSVDSGGIPSLRSIEVPTPTPTPPTPFLTSECPLSNSTNIRGQTTQRSKSRVDAMLERALTQPQQCSVDPLENAHSWGIPIWATEKLQTWLDKIYLSLKNANSLKDLKGSKQHSSGKDLKVKHLRGPYVKFESYNRNTRPVFLELPAWPILNFDGEPGTCPFDTRKKEKPRNSAITKEVKENNEGLNSVHIEEGKEMTRRPRTTATRTRRTEQLVAGYCEICRVDYRDLSKHVQSDQHLNFVRNDDNFLSLDTLINAGANVEAFLKLNRTKDIGRDCSLFPNEDRSLHDVVIPEEKTDKSTTNLSNYDVEDIKMGQYNGSRRNLNLKLSPTHNLRTRAKHESGHLLRSKGSPWHEVEKGDKFYDKFEGFTIKKRAKGTIWLEEEEPDDKCAVGDDSKVSRHEDFNVGISIKNFSQVLAKDERRDDIVHEQNSKRISIACDERVNFPVLDRNEVDANSKIRDESRLDGNDSIECKTNINGFQVIDNSHISIKTCKNAKDVSIEKQNRETQEVPDVKQLPSECNGREEVTCNGHEVKNDQKDVRGTQQDALVERQRCPRSGRRGGRTSRGRHRLSVEERLIEDNRAYYKVEVLGSKLRSSVVTGCNVQSTTVKDADGEEKKEAPSSEKPVVVRFKRVRKSELSLLSDEAESFMFGEPKRDDSSEASDMEQSSVLPRDTESEGNETNSILLSSPLNTSSPVKQEILEEDSQDSLSLSRARKRRRTQAEAFIKDNTDYYKFETPGSRLRYQTALNGVKDTVGLESTKEELEERLQDNVEGKIYPSKPSPEVEKMQFSFEAIPKSEPWYQTYQRQDEGAEFWHYFSEGDTRPFLLPYEIENFYETLNKNHNRTDGRRKGRGGRPLGVMGRSPRKSPRCHASTLAIMSTIIRKREQQHPPTLPVIEECQPVTSQPNTPAPEQKERKSDVDEDLKEIAKNIDDMLNMKIMELEESFEPDNPQIEEFANPKAPKGPPDNLLELLDNCHEISNCLENSSCASSECGEGSTESPLKRRKKRKNRTGWPGIKMRKKMQSKQLVEHESEPEKKVKQEIDTLDAAEDVSNRVLEGNEVDNTSRVQEECLPSVERKEEAQTVVETPVIPQETLPEEDLVTGETVESADKNPPKELENHDSLAVPETINELENNFVPNGDVASKNLSENDASNDENHENFFRKEVNLTTPLKTNPRKRQRIGASTDSIEVHVEMENHDVPRKTPDSGKKRSETSITPTKKRPREPSDDQESELDPREEVFEKNSPSKRRIKSRKRQRRNTINRSTVFEDENCIDRKQQQGLKRRLVSSSGQESEIECTLNARVSPTMISATELEQRRSSVEFQPVVRVMKIDDQVDVDHSILSVTVASNRRLRSAGSPRSNTQPPKKRLKTGRGQFNRWLKNS